MTKGRILVVEDDADNLQLVCILLETAGHEVLTSRSGQEGLDLVRQEHPDLVVMDLSLPEVDGWTAARELKADPQTAVVPLLALTAHTLPGDRKRALEAGFDGYISKPINIAVLIETVSRTLEQALTLKEG
ncbi:MAG: response regulator [Anaerolineales bacterium]|nr:response regulator [Anaerolineales bacterium]